MTLVNEEEVIMGDYDTANILNTFFANIVSVIWWNMSYELRVTSWELRVKSFRARVESLKVRVEIQKCEFKSTSYESKSTS